MAKNVFATKRMIELNKIAKKNRGVCLSKKYKSAKTKLRWKCEKNHIWLADPDHILRGQWCPKCAILKNALRKKGSIDEMKALAKKRAGKCLSLVYVNGRNKLLWECKNGHKWSAVPESIKAGTWCPICAGNSRYPEARLRVLVAIANRKGGKCLSKKYLGANKHLDWECEKKHKWSATPSSVKSGSWCPECSKNISGASQRSTIYEMQEIARSRGGKCLSNIYVNSQTKLEWQCYYGHIWMAIPNSIKRGTWCPFCKVNIGEEVCRYYFEATFGASFPKVRPAFLVYSGNRLELDGYNERLKIAFEHQGVQHFRALKHFGGETGFNKLKKRDNVKKKLCQKNGIKLIVVDDLINIIKFENIIGYLSKLLDESDVKYNRMTSPKELNLKQIFTNSKKLYELGCIAESRGGRLISSFYLGATTKLDWECDKGHSWSATPASVKGYSKRAGTWCPICAVKNRAKKIRGNLSDLKEVAKKRGGVCLSRKYENNCTKLQWECKEGHRWLATPSSIKNGTWCPKCYNPGESQRGNINEMRSIAIDRGGRCLSVQYVNAHTKLEWECGRGHRWFARPSDVKTTKSKKGTWCPICTRS